MIKKALPVVFLVVFGLFGEEPTELRPASIWDYHPIHAGGNLIAVGNANVKQKGGEPDGELTYNKANAYAYCFVPISRQSYFLPRVEWNAFTMDWDRNPKFHETHFQFVQFALTFLSTAVEKWRWIGRIDYNIDVKHFTHPKTYGLFSALLWGSHEFHRKWHYHVGALATPDSKDKKSIRSLDLTTPRIKNGCFKSSFRSPIPSNIRSIKSGAFRLKGGPLKSAFALASWIPNPAPYFATRAWGPNSMSTMKNS